MATPEGCGVAREGVAMQAKNKLTKATANAVRNIGFPFERGFKAGLIRGCKAPRKGKGSSMDMEVP
jgi:hypothetical protein